MQMTPLSQRIILVCACIIAGCSSPPDSGQLSPGAAPETSTPDAQPEAGPAVDAAAEIGIEEVGTGPEDSAIGPEAAADGPVDAPEAGPPFYKNVVLDESGDPDCARFGSKYYLYLPDQVRKNGEPVGGRVVGFSSTDLVHWTSLGEVFSNVGEAYGGEQTVGLWAPEVLQHSGKYYLYYVNVMTGGADSQVGNKDVVVIESDTPADFHGGKNRTVLLNDDYAFIDPSPFEDPVTHKLYLVYKRRGTFGTGSELRVRPLSSPTAFSGAATVLLESQNVPDSLSIVEHPMLWRAGSLYYLLFSKGQGDNVTYKIAYATSKSVTGPYTQQKVLYASDTNLGNDLSKKVIAPGAASIVRDGAGATWMVYRQKKTADVTFADRGVCIDAIDIRPAEQAIVGDATKGVLRPAPAPL